MAIHAPSLLASWSAPAWADAFTTDDDAVIYSRMLGHMMDLDGSDLSVELVQRDELDATVESVAVRRQLPYLRLAGERVSADVAAQLADMLMAADALLHERSDDAQPDRAPIDRVGRLAS